MKHAIDLQHSGLFMDGRKSRSSCIICIWYQGRCARFQWTFRDNAAGGADVARQFVHCSFFSMLFKSCTWTRPIQTPINATSFELCHTINFCVKDSKYVSFHFLSFSLFLAHTLYRRHWILIRIGWMIFHCIHGDWSASFRTTHFFDRWTHNTYNRYTKVKKTLEILHFFWNIVQFILKLLWFLFNFPTSIMIWSNRKFVRLYFFSQWNQVIFSEQIFIFAIQRSVHRF